MFLKRKVGVTERPRSLNLSKAIAMAICPVIWGEYLVNKPFQAAGMWADNVRGGEIVRKMNIWPRNEASRANVKF